MSENNCDENKLIKSDTVIADKKKIDEKYNILN